VAAVTDRPRAEAGAERLRAQVRERYGRIAGGGGCCGSGSAGGSCCADAGPSVRLGYPAEDLEGLPPGADLGLGCGNPIARSSLRPGEVVLDLGSGAGLDCFLAAREVGARGRVIGVDMTPEMVARARSNARAGPYPNVEFRLGEIEHLPVADATVDVVVSNCVINLAPDKAPVYREAFRVLRPGGRLAVADVVATRPVPRGKRDDPSRWSSCSSGALAPSSLTAILRRTGFVEVAVDVRGSGPRADAFGGPSTRGVRPAEIRAVKPRRKHARGRGARYAAH
jgi:arsenite methyltransferase